MVRATAEAQSGQMSLMNELLTLLGLVRAKPPYVANFKKAKQRLNANLEKDPMRNMISNMSDGRRKRTRRKR